MAESVPARGAACAKALRVEQGVFEGSVAGGGAAQGAGVCTEAREGREGPVQSGLAGSWQGFGFYSQRSDTGNSGRRAQLGGSQEGGGGLDRAGMVTGETFLRYVKGVF